ncbi:serine-rich adhesin for platelets-like isoform X2 [Hibiscus syriacus]|uniref:serine-rich adhesin for platelets-like isoform X2 n=1 Tax=Hibiscus syriacus TaxID=106335 RepID=UPI0019246851|nr:serine-rich adhesin for platelets-like isoform X2 [Hibiscus syriacus]
MVDSEKQSDFNIKGLSLVDVSSEDDRLVHSPLCDPIIPQSSETGSETKTVRFAMDSETVEISSGSHDEAEKTKEPLKSPVQNKTSKNGKYNLRKSLAWDSAFFTSEGFLEPEELSSMLGGNEKDQIQALPAIQEDVNKSFDSLTTLDSETLTLESLEADLFEDVRASIQKSNKVSVTAKSSGKKELKTTDGKTVSSSKKVELATQDKKVTPRKPNIGVKDSAKTLKQVVRPQISQTMKSVARGGESTSSLHKPPKVLSSVGPSPKKVSLGAKNVRMEKDIKTVTGRGTTVLKTPLGGARSIVPRPKPSSKSSSCSPSSSKTELNSSCSSLESCVSVSSNRTNKSSLNLIKPKNGPKIVPKSKVQAGSSKLPTFLKSSTKISSSISPASSISEWSSESSSSISAANQSSNVARASLGSGSRKGPAINSDAHQVLDLQNHPTGEFSQGDGAEVTGLPNESENKVSPGTSKLHHPASMKPSGLRMPSPKLGFFDGVRSSGRTPNGSMLTHPGVPSGLPKIGAKTTSPSVNSKKAKIGKLQPVRTLTAIRSPKVDVKQTSSAIKSSSSISIQKSSIAGTTVSSSSRNLKTSPGISPKLQNKSSPRNGIGSAEKVAGQESKEGARIKDAKIVPLDGVLETTSNIASKLDVQNTIASKEAAENETYSYPYPKTETVFLYDANKKEETPVEDQIGAVRKDPKAEFENSLSNPSPSPMTSEVTCGSRIPLLVKDSFYNTDAPHDVLSGSAATEKTTTLDSTFPENNS